MTHSAENGLPPDGLLYRLLNEADPLALDNMHAEWALRSVASHLAEALAPLIQADRADVWRNGWIVGNRWVLPHRPWLRGVLMNPLDDRLDFLVNVQGVDQLTACQMLYAPHLTTGGPRDPGPAGPFRLQLVWARWRGRQIAREGLADVLAWLAGTTTPARPS